MVIYPAIDLKDGKCVRLLKGVMEDETVYSDNPVDFANKWQDSGATHLHVVDLDGAINGRLVNLEQVKAIRNAFSGFIQFGGGVRSKEIIEQLVGIGVNRVIVGTKAIYDEEFVREIVNEFGDKVAISLDANGDMIATKGWVESTSESVVETAKRLERLGVTRFVYTQISRDGTLEGPDINGLKKICENVSVPVIASGGIGDIDDIKKIINIENIGIDGIIVGKALYENKVDLAEAMALTDRQTEIGS